MLTRREFIRTATLFALAPPMLAERTREIWVNDVHSQLNRTRVLELLTPRTEHELAEAVRSAGRRRLPISVSGCRHSMGGQQFATESLCLDTRSLNRVISFDRERGLITAEAGIQWPELIRCPRPWPDHEATDFQCGIIHLDRCRRETGPLLAH